MRQDAARPRLSPAHGADASDASGELEEDDEAGAARFRSNGHERKGSAKGYADTGRPILI